MNEKNICDDLMSLLMQSTLPTTRNFHAEVDVSFECLSCSYKMGRQEYYRDFSIDLDLFAENSSSSSFFAPAYSDRNCVPGAKSIKSLPLLLQSFFRSDERDLACEHCGDNSAKFKVLDFYKKRYVVMRYDV